MPLVYIASTVACLAQTETFNATRVTTLITVNLTGTRRKADELSGFHILVLKKGGGIAALSERASVPPAPT